MSACEKCWRESRDSDHYRRLLESREDNPCTPEEQAGFDAKKCRKCGRMTLHQYTGECMNKGCILSEMIEVKAHAAKGDTDAEA